MEAALFQELGNSPATFDASRRADYYGCLPGHDVQMADAIQAYIQAKLSGVPCWVELPDEAWHASASKHKFRRPVCRLVKALLYGHPDACWNYVGATLSHRSTKGRFQASWRRVAIIIFPSRSQTAPRDLCGRSEDHGQSGICCVKNFVWKKKHHWVCILDVASPRARQLCMTRQRCKLLPTTTYLEMTGQEVL